jgi:predicted HicB family RNase H-like nuclease
MSTKPNKFAAAADFIRAAPTEAASGGGRRPPAADSRLTVNIDRALHLRVKLYAVANYTSIGELIEEWIEQHVPPG